MIVYGVNPVLEALRSESAKVMRLIVSRGKVGRRLQQIIDLARSRSIPLHFEPPEVLSRKAETARHQDVLAELAEVGYSDLDDLLAKNPTFLLTLDGVEDPRNLGAVLRTAEACGVDGVLIPERHSAGLTAAAVKASAGAALHLPVARVGNVARTLERLKEKGFWTVGLDMSGKPGLQDIDATLPLAVVVGGEDRGIRRLVAEKCDFLVSLPMRGKVSSLNLSVAAGILLFQIAEKRSSDGPPLQGRE